MKAVYTLFLFWIFLKKARGDITIDLESCPQILRVNQTETLTLRCSFVDSVTALPSVTSSGLVGRDVSDTNDLNLGFHMVDAVRLTGARGGVLAEVTYYRPAHVVNASSGAHVSGDVYPGRENFLQVTWQQPTEQLADIYQCHVTVKDRQGALHNITGTVDVITGDTLEHMKQTVSGHQTRSSGILYDRAPGVKLSFQSCPDVFRATFDKPVVMRCSVLDDAATGARIQAVNAITVSRDQADTVASITEVTVARAMVDAGRLAVTGSLAAGNASERAYLSLTWQHSHDLDTAGLQCDVTYTDHQGDTRTLTANMEVYTDVALSQLKNQTAVIEKDYDDQISQLVGHITILETDNIKIQSQINEISKNLSSLNIAVHSSTAAPSGASPAATSATSTVHVESGTVYCDDSDNWPKDSQNNWARSRVNNVQFKTPYTSVPHVQVMSRALDQEAGENVRFDISVINIGKYGFDVKCLTWDSSHMYHVWVNWLTIA